MNARNNIVMLLNVVKKNASSCNHFNLQIAVPTLGMCLQHAKHLCHQQAPMSIEKVS